MKALSILQPWAFAIVRPDLTTPEARALAALTGEMKDIENRKWATGYRGRFLVHAGKKWGPEQREDLAFLRDEFPSIPFPDGPDGYDLGGVIGAVDMVGCVTDHASPWFYGPFGFVLANAAPAPRFLPWRGQLGWFDIPSDAFEVRHG